jgi:hypothetical protein
VHIRAPQAPPPLQPAPTGHCRVSEDLVDAPWALGKQGRQGGGGPSTHKMTAQELRCCLSTCGTDSMQLLNIATQPLHLTRLNSWQQSVCVALPCTPGCMQDLGLCGVTSHTSHHPPANHA